MARYGAPRDQGSGFQASRPVKWMVAVPTVILVQAVTPSLPGMRLSDFSVGAPV